MAAEIKKVPLNTKPHRENSGDNHGRGNDKETPNARRVLHHEANEDATDRLR